MILISTASLELLPSGFGVTLSTWQMRCALGLEWCKLGKGGNMSIPESEWISVFKTFFHKRT